MAKSDKLVAINHPDITKSLEVHKETGKLFWDGKEIATKHQIDAGKFSKPVTWLTTAAVILGGFGAAVDAALNLSKDKCWVILDQQECKKSTTPACTNTVIT
jgi:hypothetical protein